MKKLFYGAFGATLMLLSASPALAQSVQSDLATAVQNRVAIDQDMASIAAQAASTSADASDEAVLGVSALPAVGVDAPIQVKLDMLAALRVDARKIRDLANLPTGPSSD